MTNSDSWKRSRQASLKSRNVVRPNVGDDSVKRRTLTLNQNFCSIYPSRNSRHHNNLFFVCKFLFLYFHPFWYKFGNFFVLHLATGNAAIVCVHGGEGVQQFCLALPEMKTPRSHKSHHSFQPCIYAKNCKIL